MDKRRIVWSQIAQDDRKAKYGKRKSAKEAVEEFLIISQFDDSILLVLLFLIQARTLRNY